MDFSCVYRLQCKDKEIKELYIGSTKNYRKRKSKHKCSTELNFKVYKFIRENGGWENWEMIVEVKTPNHTKEELLELEQIYKDLLNPTLNSYNVKGRNIEQQKKYQKIRDNIKANCPQCGKEMLNQSIKRHLKGWCKS
tara:strand:- start:2289 stop:2702 length:414 start_codon:yes stop_codon:yes gene_type:complete